MIIDAVVRNLEIIGEASKNIPITISIPLQELDLGNAKAPWSQMNGMRNLLIHEYFEVDVKIVWHTIRKDLPVLQELLKEILKNSG